LQPAPRRLRGRASIADESGGEEILYPRNLNTALHDSTRIMIEQRSSTDDTPRVARYAERSLVTENSLALPPSSFSSQKRSARKRTSDEFEFDQTGTLISKYVSSSSSSAKDKSKEEILATTRRHRSLNSGSASSRDGKTRERQRESIGLSLNTILNASTYIRSPDRHTRQTSTGSTSSSLEPGHSRRPQPADFSHLPPSPSSNSIQHLLRSPNTASAPQSANSQVSHPSSKDNLHAHASPNVAHSLVSGTQAGWSSLNDEAAADVLRKLDGLSGKGARARASVASFGRPSSSSRPATPSKPGNQWDVSASDSAKSKHGNKDNGKDVTRGGGGHIPVDNSAIATSSDDQLVHIVAQEKTPKKSTGIKLSFTPKRGSTSSTTYTSTPSSRDSASMSATTSVTSMSAASGRHSSNKARRNSAGSDVSSVHSSEALRDRVASIALNGDGTDDGDVPPVPPLPKDLSNYRSPPPTSAGYAFPTISSDEKDKTPRNDPSSSRSISLDVPPSPVISPPAPSSGRSDSQQYSSIFGNDSVPAVRTPSKKWSISNALNKLGSPSSSSHKSGFPLSPRAAFVHQLRKSSSKDQQIYSLTSMSQWSPKQPAAMASVHSLASISSLTSAASPTQTNNAKTPDRAHASSSRPGTGSSVSTNNTTSALSAAQNGPLSPAASVRRTHSKRLTPSSIPFFSRRSSSQSMQPPPPIQSSSSISPIVPPSLLSAQTPRKQSCSPAQDYNVISISTSTPGTTHKKSSMLSLGLPSLLKSSSRRSLHSDAKDSDKEKQKAKAAAKEAEKGKSKPRKEDKDRSESRISVIINRKRGKVCSFHYNWSKLT